MEKVVGKVRWVNMVLLWLTYEINYLDRVAILVFLPLIRQDLGLTHAQAGQAASIFFFFYALSQLFLGGLADRVRPTRMMQFAIGLFSVATFFTGMMRNFAQFAILRAVLGLGEAIHMPPIFRSIANWFPVQEKARAMAILSLAWGVGPAFLPALLVFLHSVFGGWRGVFSCLFVVGIVAIILVGLVIQDDPDKARQKGRLSEEEYQYIKKGLLQVDSSGERKLSLKEQAAITLGDLSFWAYSLVWFFGLAAGWGVAAWVPSFLYEQHKFNLAAMGLMAGLPYLFAGLGQITAGWCTDKYLQGKSRWAIAASYVVCVPVLYYLSTVKTGQVVPLIICLVLLGFCVYFPHPVLYGYFQRRYPKETVGFSMGFSNGLGQFGSFIAPLIMGYMIVRTGNTIYYGNAFMFLSILALCAAVVALFMSEKQYEFRKKLTIVTETQVKA